MLNSDGKRGGGGGGGEAVDGPVGPLAAGYWSPAKPSGQCERGRSGERKKVPLSPQTSA